MKRLVLVAIIWSLFLRSVPAMDFIAIPPDIPIQLGGEWTIVATGEIDESSPEELNRLVQSYGIPWGSKIYLNSPGGNLISGMELGRLIRRLGLWTDVGIPNPNNRYMVKPGVCLSVCALSYLGGYFRFMDSSAQFGVHRFYNLRRTENELDVGQILSAAIVAYIAEMDVDIALFDEIVKASSVELRILKIPELQQLRVVNNGVLPELWTLESTDGTLYVRGEQITWRGISKLIVLCDDGITLIPFFQISDDILGWGVGHELIVDGEHLSITQYKVSDAARNGDFVSLSFRIPTELAIRISEAESVGYAFRTPNPDMFWGFEIEKGSSGYKLDDFLQSCR